MYEGAGNGYRVLLALPAKGVQFGKGLDSAVGQGPRPHDRPTSPAARSRRQPACSQLGAASEVSRFKRTTRGAVRRGRRLSVPNRVRTERQNCPQEARWRTGPTAHNQDQDH